MDPYGNAANQYGQEMQFGVRLQDAINQRQAEMPNQFFDRFIQSYRQQIKQKMLEQQMARQQQHEDTYLKMAQEREARDRASQINATADDIYNQYGGDPGQREMFKARLVAQGLDPAKAEAMLPSDSTVVPDQGQKIGTINGQDITLPETQADIKTVPGMGGGYKQKIVEAARKAALDKAREDQAAAALQERERFANLREDRRDARQEAQFAHAIDMLSRKQANVSVNVGGAGGGLSQDAIDMMAKDFATTRNIPVMFRGKEGEPVKRAIINRAAEMFPNLNLSEAGSNYKSDTSSLGKVKQLLDGITAFENTALGNMKRYADLVDKTPDVGVAPINQALRAGKKAIGDPDVAAAEAARITALNEVAKIVTNPNMTGVLTVEAQREVHNMLQPGATAKQVRSVLELLSKDMEQRKRDLGNQVQAIQSRISGGGTAEPKTSSAPITGGVESMKEGTISKSGKYIWKNGAWVLR